MWYVQVKLDSGENWVLDGAWATQAEAETWANQVQGEVFEDRSHESSILAYALGLNWENEKDNIETVAGWLGLTTYDYLSYLVMLRAENQWESKSRKMARLQAEVDNPEYHAELAELEKNRKQYNLNVRKEDYYSPRQIREEMQEAGLTLQQIFAASEQLYRRQDNDDV